MRRPSPHRRSPRGPGVVLLEVLLALTLFVVAAAVVGSAARTAIQAVERTRAQSKACDLALSVLAQLSAGMLEAVETPPSEFQDETDGEVIEPGWTYEILAEEFPDVPGLKRLTVVVRNEEVPGSPTQRLTQWLFDPAAAGPRAQEPPP